MSILRPIGRAVRRVLRVVTRPVRRGRGLKGVVIQPYRGYGTAREVYLMGRVFHQPRFGVSLPAGSLLREISDVLRRFARWGLGDTTVSARFAGRTESYTTDRDGYFRIALRPGEPLDPDTRWHTIHLEASRDGETARAEGLVYVPPSTATQIVVSDIDDTVMRTGVANKALMLWRLFVEDAESRVAFPGVEALYRGLHAGAGKDEGNPMLYVSRAPWSIYEVLETFFRFKNIPEGPILFLREWGMTLQSPLPRRARDHKRDLIEEMLERYPDLPFILIGDSGQHDPEIYARVVHDHPGRVRAVYIRDVGSGRGRADEIHRLADEMARAGIPLVLAENTEAIAAHAAEAGFLDPSEVGEPLGRAESEPRQASA